MGKYEEIDLSKLKRYSARDRFSKVTSEIFAKPPCKIEGLKEFVDSLPKVLKANELRMLVEDIVRARSEKREIILTMGAHPIKCGLSPVIIDLMSNGFITCLATNGASIIHDTEIAFFGATSEEVDSAIKDGSFGMAGDTADFINNAVKEGQKESLGFGEAVGKRILFSDAMHIDKSISAQAYRLGIPLTVHVAIGTDIIHPHPSADGSAIGELSLRDFRILTKVISRLEGGVLINFGSTVVMPEVFLKALSTVRNLGHNVYHFTTANFDMVQHYRPNRNIVERPTNCGGKGYTFTGHHEIMLPLLAALIKAYA
jgi:hypothetical protein